MTDLDNDGRTMHPDLWADPQEPAPRVFLLLRTKDHSGISGVGVVAEGVEFSDGSVAMRWKGDTASTVFWADLHTAMSVHGHNGDTTVEYL